MIDNIRATFIAEAQELITDLEKSLLNLEQDPKNKESISTVFRSMHSLKGSASMFGFESISALTHNLETIYESIRDGKSILTHSILSVTFNSLDHLKRLLDDSEMKNKELKNTHISLLKDIESLLAESKNTETNTALSPSSEKAAVENTYYIFFKPIDKILHNGTNTLYLIEDMMALGEGISLPFFQSMPLFAELQADLSYTGFEIVLSTNKTEEVIHEVFMFVESECELVIHKISEGNLLNEEAKEKLNKEINFSFMGEDKIISILIPATKSSSTASVAAKVQQIKNVSNVRVSSERLDEFMNMVSELVTIQASLSLHAQKNESPQLLTIAENVEKITRRLRDNAFTMSLIPIESLVIRYQRLVRDLSLELKKDVVFKTEGTETEIDKSIIEKLTDPLLHLLRNSLDHGIESPEVRVSKGKPKQGVLLLKSYYSGANVIIEISDDGAGLNLEKIRAKAISKGLIAHDAIMSEKELINLIFTAGFSTAEQLTGVSGRGVGMDVVRRNISDIRGDIEVNTKENKGTTFKIRLPLTLSIIDGLLVRIGETDFILPLSSVDKCYEVETKILEESFNQWVTLEGQRTPYLFLRRDFNIANTAPSLSQVIKIAYEGGHVGLAVDRIVGEYQAVLKPLGELYLEQDEFSGSTILGDGVVALVMDPNRLIKKLLKTGISGK